MSYNLKGPVPSETIWMKLYPLILILFQLMEMTCYTVLFRYLAKHHKEMVDNQIISNDHYRAKKRIHLFSLYAHIAGFVVEVIYLVAVLCLRIVGKKFSPKHSIDVVNLFRMTEFGVTSTVQILVSSDLRQKLLSFLRVNFS